MYKTNEPLPTEQAILKRNEIIESLLKSKIVEKGIKKIQNFLKSEGLETASINMQIFPEFCEDTHGANKSLMEGRQENVVHSNRGNFYLYNTNLEF